MDNMDTSNKMSIYSLVKPNFDLPPSTKDGDGANKHIFNFIHIILNDLQLSQFSPLNN
jgi:hypothetical protein